MARRFLLFVFMFFRWYEISVQSSLLARLSLFDNGGNTWQMLDALPIFLALCIAVTVGAALLRFSRLDWESPVSPGAVVCALGGIAALLILIRIVVPPSLGSKFEGVESEGFMLDVTLKAGIFLALAAACGIAYGGYRAMREEGVSLADLRPRRLMVFVCVAAVSLACVAISGCSSGNAARHESQATVRRSVPWALVNVVSADTLRIVAHVAYCVGEFEPEIAQVNVNEYGRAIAITFEAEVARVREREREVACLGAARPLYRNVELSRPLEMRTIMDGGVDPPKRRWPNDF